MTAMSSGDYSTAIRQFSQMLSINPSLQRPRLELARAFFLSGQYEASEYHFEQVLATGVPETVESNVLNYINAIRVKTAKYDFVMEMIANTNPAKASTETEVTIRGLTFKITSEQPEPKNGLHTYLGTKQPLFDSNWFITLAVDSKNFEGRSSDSLYGRTGFGHTFEIDTSELTLETGAARFNYQGEPLYTANDISSNLSISLTPQLRASLSGQVQALTYDTLTSRDSLNTTWSTGLTWVTSPRSRLTSKFTQFYNDATEEPFYSLTGEQLDLLASYEFDGGVYVRAGIELSENRRLEQNALFGVTQADEETTYQTEFIKRDWSFFNLTPVLTIGKTKHHSNIPIYAWEDDFVTLGFRGRI